MKPLMDQQSRIYYQGQRIGFVDGLIESADGSREPAFSELYSRSLKEALAQHGADDHWAAGYRLGYRRGYGGADLPDEALFAPLPISVAS